MILIYGDAWNEIVFVDLGRIIENFNYMGFFSFKMACRKFNLKYDIKRYMWN